MSIHSHIRKLEERTRRFIASETPASTKGEEAASRFRPVRLVLLLLFALVILRNGWVSDDAHIILRTLDNFVNGLGLTFNPSERVQAFTCPLWTLLLSLCYAVTGEGYYTTIAVSWGVSLFTVYLVASRIAHTLFSAMAAMLVLLLSRAFIDFSTSGLENPLTHLLIVGYTISARHIVDGDDTPQGFARATLLLSLLVLNRMDTALIFAPAHLYLLFSGTRIPRRLAAGALAALPLALWFLFAFVYYGFFLPNTAYAKLSTGISSPALWIQGLFYLRNSLFWDPITPVAIGVAVGAVLLRRSMRTPLSALLVLGMVLHLVYVVRVGGDHMSGRFLTPVFVLSASLLATVRVTAMAQRLVVVIGIVVVGFMAENPTLTFDFKLRNKGLDPAAIADEREFCFKHYGLFYQSRALSLVNNYLGNRGTRHLRSGAHVLVDGHIGLFGYHAGPTVHLVDPLALTDPLLARLPIPWGRNWRIGHFARIVPKGYTEAIDGTGRIADPDLRKYYDRLRYIVSGDVLNLSRFREAVRFNLGEYDYLKERYVDRNLSILEYQRVSAFKREGPVPWNEADNLILGTPGIGIRLPRQRWESAKQEGGAFSVSLSGGYTYDILYFSEGEALARDAIDLTAEERGVLATFRGRPPRGILSRSIDLIRIKPRSRNGSYGLGHFRFETAPDSLPIARLQGSGAGYTFTDRDLEVVLPKIAHPGQVRLSVPGMSAFHLAFFKGDERIWHTGVVIDGWRNRPPNRITLPQTVRDRGIDRIQLSARVGNEPPKLERLSLVL